MYRTIHKTHEKHTSMPPAGFEPTISTGEWAQTHALDRAATLIGDMIYAETKLSIRNYENRSNTSLQYNHFCFIFIYNKISPIPVAAWSRAWVCGHSLAGIAGSNAAGDMDVRLFECCVLSGRGFCVGLITHPEKPYRVWCV